MKFTQHWSTKATRQSQAIPGAGQVENSAGGFVFPLDPWALLDRFLILGSENGTYYVSEQKLTEGHARNALNLLKQDGARVVARVVEVSVSGRAPKNDAAIFLLAMAAAHGDPETRAAAFEALPRVCRTGTHLFQFASEVSSLRGWGRGLRRAVQGWYNQADIRDLTLQAIKYQQRAGWSHRDLLRLSHPKPPTGEHKGLYKWIVDGKSGGGNERLEAFLQLRATEVPADAAQLISDWDLPRECVPTELLAVPEVWEALLAKMPMTAMIRNLATMTRVGLLTPGSRATAKVLEKLSNEEAILRARVHPMTLLLAHSTYAGGRGVRGQNTWTAVPKIVDALDAAFYTAFKGVEKTGKRYLLGVDVSGSMSSCTVAGAPLSACEAATALAMVTMVTEDWVLPMAFKDQFAQLPLTPKMRLKDAMKYTREQNFGATDCSLPMITAKKNKWPVDVFVVYTDNETWSGNIHPVQALAEYRQAMGIPAKLIVVGMASNGFSIASPTDPGMLDVVGFDASVPQVMREFALS